MKYILTILVFICLKAGAVTYYFSSTAGDDTRTLTQAQNPATPWQSISKLNSFFASLNPGDNVLFKRGDTFYGGIVTNKNGTLGNNIKIGSYGTGAEPVITGFTAVTSWTNLGGGIYESTSAVGSMSVARMIIINGVEYAMGRTPNRNAANGGYLNFESFTGSSITDNTNPFTNSIAGATVVTRTQHPIIDQMTISSVSGNTINFTGSTTGTLINGYGYFIQNHSSTLDQYGEWYYNPSTHKIRVYFGSNPTAPVRVATQNILISVPNSYITIDGIHLYGANTYGIYCTNVGTNLLVNNCTIDFSGIDGISMAGKQNFICDSSTINYANSCGVSVGFGNVNPIIRNTTIKNIATFNGMLFKDDRLRYGFGIYSNEGLTAIRNILTNMGANGINAEGSNNLMQYNFVDTFGVVLDDVGGLYMYNHNPPAPVQTNNAILDNIVLHGIGDPYGTTSSTYRPAEGIYLDNNVVNVVVARNTAAYCADFGLYLHNDSAYVIRENVFFDNGASQIGLQQDNTNPKFEFEDGIINRNQLFSIDAARILYFASDNNNMFSFADLDSNWYCRPLNTSNIIQTNWFGNSTTNYNLSTWQSASGHDAHTLQTPVAVTSADDVLFLYNETNSDQQFSLGFNTYKSVPGVDYSGSITLDPFTSVILLKTGSTTGDTTYATYEIQHDTLLTTTIPEQYIPRDTTYTVFDTAYNVYYDFKIYASVDGSVDVTETLYDTIPAHDSTFICRLCAVHDTTVMIINPQEPEEVVFGMFPNPPTFSPFAQRLRMTKDYSNEAFRDNYDAYNSSWKVDQVHDSALLDLMTYNAPECCHLYPFPTGSELTRQLNGLDSTLAANPNALPDLISFNNEEPNKGYWTGLAADYVAWMNGATAIAHKYGIPASNGGLLQNVIWYIRWVYQQEGKTDSVAMINSMTGYGPNTQPFQQAMIDWYKVEIPAITASNLDYVNFHWYEPSSLRPPGWQTPDTITTASGLLPILINFLGRTGKPVITTEFGTGNDQSSLFFEVCNQIKDAGVKIMVYYAGEGPLARSHPDWWEAFILQ